MIEEALKYCAKVTKESSSTFYKAFQLLNKDKKYGIYVVYAFCREIDNLVDFDNELTYKQAKLKEYYQKIENIESYIGDDKILIALKYMFEKFNLEKQGFIYMIQGQTQDLTKSRYKDLDELLEYCYLVASSVGLMINPILTNTIDEKSDAAAKYIGYGLQITNILRDIGEDYFLRDRIYVPESIMQAHNVTVEDFQNKMIDQKFINMFTQLEQIAEDFYAKGIENLTNFPFKERKVMEMMVNRYQNIIKKIKKDNYQIFEEFKKYGDGAIDKN